MTVIAGQRNTSNIDSNLRRIDIGSEIALLESTSTPLTALLNRVGSERVVAPKYQNFEDVLPPSRDQVNNGSGITNSATTVAVDNETYFQVEDIVLNTRTGELFRVTAKPGSGNLTVTRGVGNSGTGVAMNDNDELYIVSSAAMEGDVSKQAKSDTPSIVTNYTQIVRDPFDESGTLLSTDVVTDSHDWNYVSKKVGIVHATKIEKIFWFGKPSETGSPAVRTSGGFFYYQGSTNQTDAGGTFTETEFWAAAATAFSYGSDRKLLFASRTVVSVLNQFAQSKIETRQGDTTYGLAITDYNTPFGKLSVVHHRLFNQTTVYQGYGAVVDLAALKKVYLHGEKAPGGSRDTHINEHIEENDRDGRKDEYFSEVGLRIGQPSRHAFISGVTG